MQEATNLFLNIKKIFEDFITIIVFNIHFISERDATKPRKQQESKQEESLRFNTTNLYMDCSLFKDNVHIFCIFRLQCCIHLSAETIND